MGVNRRPLEVRNRPGRPRVNLTRPKAYSLRLGSALDLVAKAADSAELSINAWILSVVKEAAQRQLDSKKPVALTPLGRPVVIRYTPLPRSDAAREQTAQ